jgi:hypothetical protein
MASRWIRTAGRRTAWAALVVLGVCVAVATAAHMARSDRRGAPLFSVHAVPGTQRVAIGGTARFKLTIQRNRPPEPEAGGEEAEEVEQPGADLPFGAPVRLSVARLPRGVTARFSRNPVRGSGSELVLAVASRTRLGTDRIVVRGTAARATVALSVRLVVSSPTRRSLAISDKHIGGTLAPGISLPVDLRLSNPYPFALRIVRLSVRVRSVSAPNASRGHPCTTRDYLSTAFSGHYGFRLASHRKVSLGGLGFSTQQWPHVAMINRSINQDGCKQAIVTLGYSGTGTTLSS